MTRKATNKSAAQDTAAAPPRIYKYEVVIAMLRREEGATLEEIGAATGWLPQSSRSVLAGLRKKGHTIELVMRYRIVEPT